MKNSKVVTVVHPDSMIRILLRTALEGHGCTVATDHSCKDLMTGDSSLSPDVILLDRSLLGEEGVDVLAQLTHKWVETEIVFLPEGLSSKSASVGQLLNIVDRLLGMKTTRELLST